MKRWVAGVVAGLQAYALCGCGAELTAAGAQVQVGKGAPERTQCRELGIVYGSGGGGGYTSAQDKLQWAQNELRNKTAELGGNFVIFDASAGDVSGISMSGRALKCNESESESVEEDAPRERTKPKPENAVAVAAPASPSAAPAPAATPEQRLRVLDDLHQKGLVTEPEYQQRRKEILDSI
jgi:hypothetical protein